MRALGRIFLFLLFFGFVLVPQKPSSSSLFSFLYSLFLSLESYTPPSQLVWSSETVHIYGSCWLRYLKANYVSREVRFVGAENANSKLRFTTPTIPSSLPFLLPRRTIWSSTCTAWFSFLPRGSNSSRVFSPIQRNTIDVHLGIFRALGHYLYVLFHKNHLVAVSVLAGAKSVGGENANIWFRSSAPASSPIHNGCFEARLVFAVLIKMWLEPIVKNFGAWSRKTLEAKYYHDICA